MNKGTWLRKGFIGVVLWIFSKGLDFTLRSCTYLQRHCYDRQTIMKDRHSLHLAHQILFHKLDTSGADPSNFALRIRGKINENILL